MEMSIQQKRRWKISVEEEKPFDETVFEDDEAVEDDEVAEDEEVMGDDEIVEDDEVL